jgi:hypothetical protein
VGLLKPWSERYSVLKSSGVAVNRKKVKAKVEAEEMRVMSRE